MKTQELSLKGAKLLSPKLHFDERGFFLEVYRARTDFPPFVQDNYSYSVRGVLRGMHFQAYPGSQAKLVSVVVGQIYDVIVDMRPSSPTCGKWEGVYLDDQTRQQLFVPAGFAHGFQVVSPSAHVSYKVSAFFNPEMERNFRFDDPDLGIKWPIERPILSKRDLEAPLLKELL